MNTCTERLQSLARQAEVIDIYRNRSFSTDGAELIRATQECFNRDLEAFIREVQA